MKYYSLAVNPNRGILVEPVQSFEQDVCDNPELYRNKEFKIYQRKKVVDAIEFDCIGWFGISEKFKKVLEDNGFTGYKLIPIHIKDIDKPYYILIVTNSAKNLTPDTEELDRFIKLNDMKKADFSIIENTRTILVNEKVKKALEKAKISNIYFENVENISDDVAFLKFYQ